MIYFVEDDASIRELVLYTLNNAGFQAEGFERPSAFWKAVGQMRPTLILLDIMLPEEDGLSILRKLRADPDTRATPVMMLTAKGTEYDTVLALDAGADDYVQKPFRMMELLSRIRALIRRSEGVWYTGRSSGISGRAFGSVARPAPGPRGWKRCDTDVEGI